MVTEQELLHSSQYQFKHIEITVHLKDASTGNVYLFGGKYDSRRTRDRFSDGIVEANITLWNPDSPKRPKGYFIIDTFDLEDGHSVVLFIERTWFFEEHNHDEQDSMLEKIRQEYIEKINLQKEVV